MWILILLVIFIAILTIDSTGRMQKEEKSKKKIINDVLIERLESLVEPLSHILDKKDVGGSSGNVPIWRKSRRETLLQQYEQETQKYNMNLIRNPPGLYERRLPPKKSDQLLTEEIYVTLIGILKKQDERIKELERKLG